MRNLVGDRSLGGRGLGEKSQDEAVDLVTTATLCASSLKRRPGTGVASPQGSSEGKRRPASQHSGKTATQ